MDPIGSFFSGRKVLVAGGAGLVGANLVQRLLDAGAQVRATLFKRDAVIKDDRVEYLRCDLTLAEDCAKAAADMEFMFMCAASTSGAAAIASTPLVHVTPNVVMNALLLEAAYAAGVRKTVYLSSSVVYPPTGQTPAQEDTMLSGEPFDVYYGAAWMKRFGEILCNLYSHRLRRTMPVVTVRPANIFGPHDKFDPATSHVMAATIRKVVDRQDPIRVWGTGEDVRDFIFADDFIDGLLLAAEKLDAYDPVNIATGRGYTVKEILGMLLELEGWTDARVEYDPDKPSMIPIRLFDTAKAERLLGFRAKTPLREALARTIAWYRANAATSR